MSEGMEASPRRRINGQVSEIADSDLHTESQMV